jgi:hypothetical protein
MVHKKQPIDADLAVRALRAALTSTESRYGMDHYTTIEVIGALQTGPLKTSNDLLSIEWAYLQLLDRHLKASPKALESKLATDPGFFCEVIRIVFRSEKAAAQEKKPTEQERNIAENGYRLMREWRRPPGLQEDGAFDGAQLAAWLAAIKRECEETGHLSVALTMVGEVLVSSPPDPDGLWLHRSAAEALNSKDAEEMRRGFTIELFNSRGIHGFSAGSEERGLAADYESKAASVEAAGFIRLATALRGPSADYLRHAEREASRNPFDDD